jgi:hypothetical protein
LGPPGCRTQVRKALQEQSHPAAVANAGASQRQPQR